MGKLTTKLQLLDCNVSKSEGIVAKGNVEKSVILGHKTYTTCTFKAIKTVNERLAKQWKPRQSSHAKKLSHYRKLVVTRVMFNPSENNLYPMSCSYDMGLAKAW